MERFVIDTEEDDEQVRVSIPHFTCIGATTSLGGLEEPCRNRFGIHVNLLLYDLDDMAKLVLRATQDKKIDIDIECASMIGKAARKVSRVANAYLRRVSDFPLVLNDGVITLSVVLETLEFMDVDANGFNAQDRAYLTKLYTSKKAVGVDSLVMELGVGKKSIETVIEPYLLQEQFVVKTPRGRELAEKGLKS